MKYYIYSLNDPDTNEVRYIGKATNPKHRFYGHLYEKSKSHKSSWIKSLNEQGKIPILDILKEFDCEKECFEVEIILIQEYKDKGCKLVNYHLGGLGGASETCKGSQNGRAKITEEIVLLLRDELLFTDISIQEISDKYNVPVTTINNIKAGIAWSHITGFTGQESFIRKNSIIKRAKAMKDSGLYDKLSISVDQYDLKGNYLDTFKSISEACSKTGTNRTSLSQCLNNKAKSANNFIWKRNTTKNVQ